MIGMRQIVLIVFTCLFAAYIVVNAGAMLISPKYWFRMPSSLAPRGMIAERKYGNKWGYVQIRLLGAVFLVTMGWIAFSLFVK
jgi:hypothetical protein